MATINLYIAFLLFAVAIAQPPPDTFRFSNTFDDDMVLQMAPSQATVWGFCKSGASVSVAFNGQTIQATVSEWLNETTWLAKLPATESIANGDGFKKYDIVATSSGDSISIHNVIFGDVWVCSGQSNMEYPLGNAGCWNESNINCTDPKTPQCSFGCVNNSDVENADMATYTNIRIQYDYGRASAVALPENINSGWVYPANISHKFSAACQFFGRDLYDTLQPPRPIGLIGTYVGGTPDQHWSSQDALDKCMNLNKSWEWPSNFTDSVLWNGKLVKSTISDCFVSADWVVMWTRMTVKGAIWYQGEANAGHDGRQYNCSFQAMIQDWRAKWLAGTGGTTDPDFPFGWAQLNSNGAAYVWSENGTEPISPMDEDPLGIWAPGFTGIRLAESYTTLMKNTFQAVILDTPVASGSVHSPFKQACGSRLARGALATTYGMTLQSYPSPCGIARQGSSIIIKICGVGSGSSLEWRTKLGFEIAPSDGKEWDTVPITAVENDSITIGPVPPHIVGVRYLWRNSPCTAVPYQCPIYASVPALGKDSGELDYLPMGPFVYELPLSL
eukprot:m.41305 g.41305  ORF g.41305 m.41305 type:complete len:558 (-) comp9753_c0_seq1:77-1750(-)